MSNVINQIKTLLGIEVKLAQMSLDNGTVLEAEVFEAGKSVFIVNGEDRIALPVGEYKLEDGKILIVTEEGIIAEIKEAVAEIEEPAEVEVEEEQEMPEAPVAKKIVESTVKETHFSKSKSKKMKNPKLKIKFTEEAAEEVVEISNEILEVISEIINEDTPDAVSVEDSKEIAADVIEAIVEILEEQPEAFKRKNKFSKNENVNLSNVKPLTHNPEAKSEVKINLYGQKRAKTTFDSVLNKIANLK
jgi:hypothetical protein